MPDRPGEPSLREGNENVYRQQLGDVAPEAVVTQSEAPDRPRPQLGSQVSISHNHKVGLRGTRPGRPGRVQQCLSPYASPAARRT